MKYQINFELSFTENTFSGKYFALEGIDGSGKTTQVERLATYFRNQGKEVLITKEPTNGEIGTFIKSVINGQTKIPPVSLQYLFAADRGVHLESEVIPSLKQGKIVLSDRSFWSAVCYGIAESITPVIPSERQRIEESHSRNQTVEIDPSTSTGTVWHPSSLGMTKYDNDRNRLLVAYNILSIYGGYLVPDKTFVIDLPADVAIERIRERKDENTLYEKREILEKVQKEYAWMAEEFREHLVLIDGMKSIDEVFKQVVSSM